MTGHEAQMALALAARRRRVEPRSPSGWKKSSVSRSRQAALYCHSHASIMGPGRRETSVKGCLLGVLVGAHGESLRA